MAGLLRQQPQRRLLDLGCSTGTLRGLLPSDFDYHGCDVAPHAAAWLDADHFRQLDFNSGGDLSAFASRGIDALHAGGLLEYLHDPAALLAGARDIVPAGSPFVLSIINFAARRSQPGEKHHPGWVFKPKLAELRSLLAASGWRVERVLPFADRRGWRRAWFRLRFGLSDPRHPWVAARADQYVLLARAA
jgi:SAM-dependent methyltransferase